MPERKLKRRIFVATGLLIIAGGAWWLWSSRSVERAVASEPKAAAPFVQLAGGGGDGAGDQLLRERALYFDPTPLFLPTPQNFGQGGLPRRLVRQPGQVFGNFPAKLHFPDNVLAPYAADVAAGTDNLPELLARANEAPFAGFGETGEPLATPPVRGALVEIKSLDGMSLQQRTLGLTEVPTPDIAPLEFIVAIGAAGLIGKPMLAASSGVEEGDAFFRDYLTKTYRIGARLAPGRYRVLIGP